MQYNLPLMGTNHKLSTVFSGYVKPIQVSLATGTMETALKVRREVNSENLAIGLGLGTSPPFYRRHYFLFP